MEHLQYIKIKKRERRGEGGEGREGEGDGGRGEGEGERGREREERRGKRKRGKILSAITLRSTTPLLGGMSCKVCMFSKNITSAWFTSNFSVASVSPSTNIIKKLYSGYIVILLFCCFVFIYLIEKLEI